MEQRMNLSSISKRDRIRQITFMDDGGVRITMIGGSGNHSEWGHDLNEVLVRVRDQRDAWENERQAA